MFFFFVSLFVDGKIDTVQGRQKVGGLAGGGQ